MEENKLAQLSDVGTEMLNEAVKKRYVEKYADTIIKLEEDRKKLTDALAKLDTFKKRIEDGDLIGAQEYKKYRKELRDNGYEQDE